jgi:hypothetical protein
MRGGLANGVHTGFRGAVTPGFRGGFDPRFNRRFFDPRFDPRFDRRFFDSRFDHRFFDPRFDRRFFDSRFDHRFFDPRFDRRFFDPRFDHRFLRRELFSDLLLQSQFAFNPFIGIGGLGSFGLGVTPFVLGSSSILADGGAAGNNSLFGTLTDEAQALTLAEKARAERIANRRKVFDEYLYERDKTPTPEQDRRKYQQEQLSRSLNNPPLTEVWSGKALNDILADLRSLAVPSDVTAVNAFPEPLNQAGLEHINVTRGAGNIGLLKKRQLTWPVALGGADSQLEREQLTTQARDAVRQAEHNGHVDTATLLQMTGHVQSLEQQLQGKARELSPELYVEAKTFLRNLTDAIIALRQGDAGSHFNGAYALKAKTIPDLVKEMNEHGLQFAAALPEDQAAYALLHQALVNYDRVARSHLSTP